MKITVKRVQGGEFSLEVLPTTSILEIKYEILKEFRVPLEDQKLLLLGRTLLNDKKVEAYPNIKDGTKLNLVVKKPETLFDVSVRLLKDAGLSETDAIANANKFIKTINRNFRKLSLDDINRLCHDILVEDLYGEQRPGLEDPTARNESDKYI